MVFEDVVLRCFHLCWVCGEYVRDSLCSLYDCGAMMHDYSTDGDAMLLDEAMSILAELRHRQKAKAKPPKAWSGRSRKLSDEDMAFIRVQHRLGQTVVDLAHTLNVSKPTVYAVLRYRGAYK